MCCHSLQTHPTPRLRADKAQRIREAKAEAAAEIEKYKQAKEEEFRALRDKEMSGNTAASQALQNLNLALGLDEDAGISDHN